VGGAAGAGGHRGGEVHFDVLGLGALNVDLIAAGPDADGGPDEDNETTATVEDIRAWLAAHGATPAAFLGGSAFNAMVMVAQLGIGLRLGMLGIAARPAPSDGLDTSHAERLVDLGIADVTRRSRRRPGLCLALSGVHRRLFTAPEANLEVTDYLRYDPRARAAAAGARVLHLTSLLEDPHVAGSNEVAKGVAEFVETAKGDNRRLLLSFDPGRTWVDGLALLPDLRRIYALADVLFVNPQEHAALGRGQSLDGLCSSHTVVVVKPTHEIVVQRADGFRVARVPRHEVAAAVDSTGAGDAVAAGVLAALGDGRNLVDGCRLGLRIAAQRVSDLGDRGHADLRRSLGALWPTEWSVAR